MYQYKVLDAPLDRNLGDFSIFLWQQGIPHRIHEQSGRQILWVRDEEHIDPVKRAYRKLMAGELRLQRVTKVSRHRDLRLTVHTLLFKTAPATLVFLLLSIIGAVLPYVDSTGQWISLLTFQGFSIEQGKPVFESAQVGFAQGQYWRLLTPIFLHFGLMHILFNGLWLWELGRRIEFQQGIVRLVALMFLVGAGSNMIQYLVIPNSLFGGMSGVIYGLLGYCWFWDKFQPTRPFNLPPGIVGFMLVWLLIGYSGVFDLFGLHIANAAHLSGLIIGVVMGGGAALIAGQQRV